jgi:hypothetical protein
VKLRGRLGEIIAEQIRPKIIERHRQHFASKRAEIMVNRERSFPSRQVFQAGLEWFGCPVTNGAGPPIPLLHLPLRGSRGRSPSLRIVDQ